MPLHEQQRLGNYSQRGAFDHLPLGAPRRQATHQGLFLDADDDVLVGRAENGEGPRCSSPMRAAQAAVLFPECVHRRRLCWWEGQPASMLPPAHLALQAPARPVLQMLLPEGCLPSKPAGDGWV